MSDVLRGVPQEDVLRGLEFLNQLPRTERDAFLGLFAGAKWVWTVWADQGRPFTMRKSECEAVEDWREFYLGKLPKAGLLTFTQTETFETASGPAYRVEICPTDLAWAVRGEPGRLLGLIRAAWQRAKVVDLRIFRRSEKDDLDIKDCDGRSKFARNAWVGGWNV